MYVPIQKGLARIVGVTQTKFGSQMPFPSSIIPKPWAKLGRDCRYGRTACRAACDCRVVSSLSLIGHSADVGAVLQALLERPTVARRLAALLGRSGLSEADRQRLVALACLHDLGKVNVGFQNRATADLQPRAGHIGPLYALLCKGSPTIADALFGPGSLEAVEHLLSIGKDDAPWVAILAHHGDLKRAGGVEARLWQAAGWLCY